MADNAHEAPRGAIAAGALSFGKPAPLPPSPYRLDAFTPLLGEAFTVQVGDERVTATLVEAQSLREVQGVGRRSQQFSLVWRGPPGLVLPQQIYTVGHPAVGEMPLFLVCIGNSADGALYEAVFT